MQKLLIIRDNAHGVDVLGKRSPDGSHHICIDEQGV